MRIGMIGLGRMGANMSERLVRAGHEVVGYARDPAAVDAVAARGAEGGDGPAALAAALGAPGVV